MKRILGLDLGTNSIGWALVESDFTKKEGNIEGLGSRILPMTQDALGKFDSGVTESQTADRTNYRGVRRLYQRDNLRRERLHRVLNILGFLPEHYKENIDFEKKLGQFKPNLEVKLPYKEKEQGFEFIFQDSFYEMAEVFKTHGHDIKLTYDWTIYYLRKKALHKKISNEELAWILLNFNQKRGYYQLRGEEEEIDKNKTKEFVQLKVKEVLDSGKQVKGKPLYDVYFENGWKYESQIVKTEDWVNKLREFIVTTTTLKDGTLKRTFKKVDSEADWIAIKEKSQKEIDVYNQKHKAVGIASYIFDNLLKNPTQKINGKLIKTIERHYYRDELKAILETQIKLNSVLQDQELYMACINELYSYNEAHKGNIKNNGFGYLFLDDIIFYQRPLKSKKSTISNCSYETRTFIKDGNQEIQPIKCIAKSNPLFQEFRLWQFIHNLKIYVKEISIDGKLFINQDITKTLLNDENAYVDLFEFLNNRAEINQNALLKYFSLNKNTYRWNYAEDNKYPCNPIRTEFIKRLSKIQDLNVSKLLTKTFEKELWHLIYSVKDKKQYASALNTFAKKKEINVPEFKENFINFKPYESAYGSYSEKAIKKLLPLMRRGKFWSMESVPAEVKNRIDSIMLRLEEVDFDLNDIETLADDDIPKQLLKNFAKTTNPYQGLNTYQACYAIYNRHSEVSEIQYWKSPQDIDNYLKVFKQHSLRNPIVEQVVTETLRVVRDIWLHYGKGNTDFFNEIHVELGREMKNDKKTRERISKAITQNENTNERIKCILQDLMEDHTFMGAIRPYSKGHQDILKLYEEGVYNNASEQYRDISIEDIDKIRRSNNPKKSEIIKYKIWLEQGYVSPYTGKIIPLTSLFSSDYQIEHVIPRSRYFDDSMGNKVICESAVNELKSNLTAYEFIKQNSKRIIDLGQGKQVELFSLEDYETHCQTYFKGQTKKMKLLLSADIPEGFINRQLNDSRYISKVVKGLLSNIVRAENEQEATSNNLVPLNGAITSKLKKDWGLNDVWDTLVAPRFQRMNDLTNTSDFRKQVVDGHGNKYMVNTVPDALKKGFTKKRIDHRHHALDALVIACTTKDHINYMNALNTQRHNHSLVKKLRKKEEKTIIDKQTGQAKTISVAKAYHKPWGNFTKDALGNLENTVVSFKNNLRVINKTNNKTWQWVEENGKRKKVLIKQEGTNWAIRKPMHKQTVYGKIDMPTPKGKIATAVRTDLSSITTRKRLEAITDISIQNILEKHLAAYKNEKGQEDFEAAFNETGIESLNANIQLLNGNKPHKPIRKVRLYEIGVKFPIGETGINSKKYVEAEKGTNLFFNVYWNVKKQKRSYETVPLNEVIEHQKQVAHLPKSERTETPINNKIGDYLFSLSPNNLVYVPTEEELNSPNLVDFKNLNKEQVGRVYKMVSSSSSQCFFIKAEVSNTLWNKMEYSALNKMERDIESNMIKDRCWKLNTDRLGNLKRSDL